MERQDRAWDPSLARQEGGAIVSIKETLEKAAEKLQPQPKEPARVPIPVYRDTVVIPPISRKGGQGRKAVRRRRKA